MKPIQYKNLTLSLIFASLVLHGCGDVGLDMLPEDVPFPNIQKELFTRGNQPAILRVAPSDSLMGLTIAFESEKGLGILKQLTEGGHPGLRAEVTFIMYTPISTDEGSDNMIVTAYDQNNTLRFKSTIPVTLFGDNNNFQCVNASFSDYATVRSDEELTMNLLENDSYCNQSSFGALITVNQGSIDYDDIDFDGLNWSTSTITNNGITSSVLTIAPQGRTGRMKRFRQHCLPNENFDFGNIVSWQNESDVFKQCQFYSATFVTIDVIDD